jgi:hypothetical protein
VKNHLLTREQILMIGNGRYRDARELGDGSWVCIGEGDQTPGAATYGTTILYVDVDRTGYRDAYVYTDEDAALESFRGMLTRYSAPTGWRSVQYKAAEKL